MNRIVRDHYPVSKLPEDLREGFGADDEVRVTVDVLDEPQDPGELPNARAGLFSRYRPIVEARFTSIEQVNDHVRALRNEWDHRDR